MNREELKVVLDRECIDPSIYSLYGQAGGPYDDRLILEQDRTIWTVYYIERGEKSQIHFFETEHEACEYLLNRLLRNPTTRLRI
jgi:hypothetical protein